VVVKAVVKVMAKLKVEMEEVENEMVVKVKRPN
jgi:hypothetical protein